MQQRQLGRTGIAVSEIGLGCASYWGKSSFPEAQAMRIVQQAIDKGVTLFDTGHSYSDGNAELRLGRCLVDVPDKSRLAISTKAGTRIGQGGRLYKDFSPPWIRQSCQESLQKLGLEAIPLLHLHGPTVKDLTDELLQELAQLKADGLVRAIGVNSFDDVVLKHLLAQNWCDFIMPDYNILARGREPLIEQFTNRGVGVIAGAALANALYSNRVFRIRSMKDLWYLARALKNFRGQLLKGFRYRFVNNHPELTGSQIAIAYILQNPLVSSAVFGTTSDVHLQENLQAAEVTLPPDMLDRILQAPR